MNKKQVLQENREYIIEEYKNGKDTVWLGKKFGVSNAYIYLFLRDECKIKMRVVQKFYSVKDKIMELYEGGAKSYNQIAKQIGVSNTTCMKYCKKLGIDFSHNDCQREVTLVSQLDEIVKDYESGMGCTKLSKKYDASEASINMFLRRHGIEAKYLKQYDIPHTFFDNIDCEEKAYVLGFFAADGCQTKNNRFQVSVTDEQILRDIYSVMKYDGPVGIRESYKDNWKEQYYFSIGSVYMCKRLTELGCPKRKSMILDMPKDEDLPINLFRHYLRGFFDGDGCVDKCLNYAKITLASGSKKFLEKINKKLDEILGVYSKIYKHDTIWILRIVRNRDVDKMFKFFYEDATIFLKRKYDRFLELGVDKSILLSD